MNNAKAIAYLLVRLHGMLLLFYSIYELTYLPFQIRMVQAAEGMEPFHSEAMQDVGILIFRFALEALLGLTLFLKTRRVIDFLMVETEKTKSNEGI